jgi:hypothetical protein
MIDECIALWKPGDGKPGDGMEWTPGTLKGRDIEGTGTLKGRTK